MKTNSGNIDNLLRNSLENFSSQPATSVRANVSLKIKKFNFFKFNPGSFNVFYLSTLIIGFSTILSFSLGLFENENDTALTETKQTEEIKKTSPNIVVEDLNNEITESNISANKTNTKATIETLNNSLNTRTYSTEAETNQFEQIETKNGIIPETTNEVISEDKNSNIANNNEVNESEVLLNSNQKDDVISCDDHNSTKIIVYDTITNINHVSVVDTVITKVKKTVHFKRPRRNNK